MTDEKDDTHMTQTHRFIQYGCGLTAPTSWRNFDASPTLRLQRAPWPCGPLAKRLRVRFPDTVEYGDVTGRLPLADGSCEAVYCSHVLEHLSLEDFRRALLETKRVLKVGGIFRGVLPDLEYIARKYIEDHSSDASIRFMRDTILGRENRVRGFIGMIEQVLGNRDHLWMWDYKGLELELGRAGFFEIRRAYFGDGQLDAFRAVEEADRWENSLGFECRA